ncbi:MAG: S-layer homology domain-containing protein [Chloroflexi bacterium]|nr:S-layer homology domain-containing protein [Chloroflexota bacterium]
MTAPPTLDADHIAVKYVTHRDTRGTTASVNHSGHYRDPLPLADGKIIAAHTSQTGEEASSGPSIYAFRLKTLSILPNGFYAANQPLTSGIVKTISYWDPDRMITYTGPLWELQPVEVRARTRPAKRAPTLGAPEQQVFTQAGVDVTEFQAYLRANNLALIVSHNVTTRDDMDINQPLNLRIPGGVQTIDQPGKIYDVKFLQLFQADQLRSLGGIQSPREGRRVLAQHMHDPAAVAIQPPNPNGPPSSVILGLDGSMAAFVPARRAMTWQLVDPNGVGVVRERVWVTFQPGEIRVCTSCHGVNDKDQAGNTPPQNQPQALLDLLEHWKAAGTGLFSDVPSTHWAADFIERLYNAGITGGCNSSPLMYCPESSVTRAQMAVFILRGMHGSTYTPPPANGTIFTDVPADYWAAAWVEQLAAEGITAGCGGGNYCPEATVTRAQMAIFLLRGEHGSAYAPPAATGAVFGDVPSGSFAADWIEQLALEGVTAGCGGGNYCPGNSVTRAEMAVFLVRTFSLP